MTDPRAKFRALVPEGASPELLDASGAFNEGPVWFDDPGWLVWSDIPGDRLLRWSPDGSVAVHRQPANHPNGNTLDTSGRLVTCEHTTRRVTRAEPDGTVTVIADRWDGRALNSPNDVVVRSDGSIWFSDPDYGLRQHCPPGTVKEQAGDEVFRWDPLTGVVERACTGFDRPNGLAFSPDETVLYVSDSGVVDGPGRNSHIRAFRVRADGTTDDLGVFATTVGIPDGMRVDRDGNLWASAGPGINVYDPDGRQLGRIDLPENVTNLAFGGRGGGWLFITTWTALYRLRVTTTEARRW